MRKAIIAMTVLAPAFCVAAPRDALAQGSWSLCADEGLWCEWHGNKEVRYGANGRYVHRRIGGGGFMCENKRFGDPAPGAKKYCWIRQ